MKLHSDTLTVGDVAEAAALARAQHGQDIYVAELVATGSRRRRGGVSFRGFAEHGRYATNGAVHGVDRPRAATWSAWGYLIAELFRRDPAAIIGQYADVAAFIASCEEMHERVAKYRPQDTAMHEIGFLEMVR
jgi:hypothetical protein